MIQINDIIEATQKYQIEQIDRPHSIAKSINELSVEKISSEDENVKSFE